MGFLNVSLRIPRKDNNLIPPQAMNGSIRNQAFFTATSVLII